MLTEKQNCKSIHKVVSKEINSMSVDVKEIIVKFVSYLWQVRINRTKVQKFAIYLPWNFHEKCPWPINSKQTVKALDNEEFIENEIS